MGSAHSRRWLTSLGQVARGGPWVPIIAILVLSGVFTVISGSYVHGGLLLVVATVLFWDAVLSRRRADARSLAAPAAPEPAAPAAGAPLGAPAGRWRPMLIVAGVAGSVMYAVMVGSFIRYSWPATVAVAVLAAAVLAAGWQGPRRPRRDPGELPARGIALWAGWMVTAGLWELAAFFQQPSLTTASYAHPTISALIDPLLASHAGRTTALAVWLVLGWFLVER